MNELHNTILIDFSILRKALDFYLKADTQYQQKDPFVVNFIKEVLNNKRNYYSPAKIIALRERLKADQRIIQHTDYGAGSQFTTKDKTVGSFVNNSASTQYKGEVLFNLARHMKANTILELGTNVGLGTAYLASANSKSRVESIEGCPQLCEVARTALSVIKINNVEITAGKFSEQLKPICEKLEKIDLVFLDGDHSYEGTLDYYETIKPHLHKNSVVVLDDINWSDGMANAWKEIKAKEEVILSIDVFRLGFVFFNKAVQKDQVSLVPYRYKFWKIGLFN